MFAPLIRKPEPAATPVRGGPRRNDRDKKNCLEREAGWGPVGGAQSDFGSVPLSVLAAGPPASAGPEGQGAFLGQAEEAQQPVSSTKPSDELASPATPAPASEAPTASPEACTMTSKTQMGAPHAPDDRTKIGVSEKVEFSIGKAAEWSATSGTALAGPGPEAFMWRAPETAGSVTIKATVPADGTSCTKTMEVILPECIEFNKVSEDYFSSGVAAAGMRSEVVFLPKDVSFANSEWLEVESEGLDAYGYFARLTSEKSGYGLDHAPYPIYTTIFPDNRMVRTDHAAIDMLLPKLDYNGVLSWGLGGFMWIIPNKMRRLFGDGEGVVFTHTKQFFSIREDGTVTIFKEGASVTRSP